MLKKRNIQHREVKFLTFLVFEYLKPRLQAGIYIFCSSTSCVEERHLQLIDHRPVLSKLMLYILVSAVYTENPSNNMYEFPLRQGSDIWITSSSSDSMKIGLFFSFLAPSTSYEYFVAQKDSPTRRSGKCSATTRSVNFLLGMRM